MLSKVEHRLLPISPISPPPATQLFKLMDKYRPETKQAKKERLRERAAARFVPLELLGGVPVKKTTL